VEKWRGNWRMDVSKKLAKRVWRFLADRMGNGWKEHELGNVSMSPPGSSVKFKVARNQMLGCSQGLRGVVVPSI